MLILLLALNFSTASRSLSAFEIAIRGRVIPVATNGGEAPALDGEISLVVHGDEPPRFKTYTAPVKAGEFTISLDDDVRSSDRLKASVVHVTLGERRALPEVDRFDVDFQGFVLIRVKCLEDVTLEVLDAETGLPVRDISLRAVGAATAEGILPSCDSLLPKHASAPIALSAELSWPDLEFDVIVESPGYANASISISFVDGGRHKVALPRGAQLTVQVRGNGDGLEKTLAPLVVRLRRPAWKRPEHLESLESMLAYARRRIEELDPSQFPGGRKPTDEELIEELGKELERLARPLGEVVLEEPLAGHSVVLSGLLASDYVVTVERGKSWDDPWVLAQSPVELLAGSEQVVSFHIPAGVGEGARVSVTGTLSVDPAWEMDVSSILLVPVRLDGRERGAQEAVDVDLRLDQAEPDLYHWDAGFAIPGDYLLQIPEWNFQEVVHARASIPIEVRINRPCDVSLALVLESTGERIQAESVWWEMPVEFASWRSRSDSLEFDDRARIYHFRAPAGAIEFHIVDRWYYSEENGIERTVREGSDYLEIPVRMLSRILVSLQCERRSIPVSGDQEYKLRRVGGEVVIQQTLVDSETQQITFRGGGPCTLIVPKIAGFRPVTPRDLVVEEGNSTTIVVSLVRE